MTCWSFPAFAHVCTPSRHGDLHQASLHVYTGLAPFTVMCTCCFALFSLLCLKPVAPSGHPADSSMDPEGGAAEFSAHHLVDASCKPGPGHLEELAHAHCAQGSPIMCVLHILSLLVPNITFALCMLEPHLDNVCVGL